MRNTSTPMSKELIEAKQRLVELAKDVDPDENNLAEVSLLIPRIAQLEAREETTVEIARSFSYKLNVGNYESRDFFCSQKAECKWKDAEEISAALYAFCKNEVLKSVNEFRLVDTKKSKDVSKDSAEHDAGSAADEIPS